MREPDWAHFTPTYCADLTHLFIFLGLLISCKQVWMHSVSSSWISFALSFQKHHTAVYICMFMWICWNCKAIVWMYVLKKEVTRTSTSFTEHIAVFIRALSGSNTEKKVNLEQMVVAAHGFFFFSCFSLFLWYFSSFFLCESTATPAFLWHG